MQKVGYSGRFFPDGQGDRNNHCVPIHRLLVHRTAQILTQSKNSDDDKEEQPMCAACFDMCGMSTEYISVINDELKEKNHSLLGLLVAIHASQMTSACSNSGNLKYECKGLFMHSAPNSNLAFP